MIDIIILLIITLSGYIGIKRGFIKTILHFSSTVLSLILTGLLLPFSSKILYQTQLVIIIRAKIYDFLEKKQNTSIILNNTVDVITNIIVNIVGFIIVIILVKFIISIVLKLFNVISKIPVLKQLNSLLGFISGIASGALICYILIGIISVIDTNIYLNSLNIDINNSTFGLIFKENNIISEALTKII